MKRTALLLSSLSPNQRGTLYVALSAILYGFMAFFGTKLVGGLFTVINMLFWRFFIAFVWMALGMLITRSSLANIKCTKSGLIKLISYNVGTYSIGSALYFFSSQYIGTGISMVIFFSYPLFVALFSYLFSQWKMNRYTLLSLAAVCAGLFCLKGNVDIGFNMVGITLAVLAALCYAIYIFCNHQSANVIQSQWLTLIICGGNSLVFFVLASSSHSFMLPQTMSAWGYALGLGIIGTALPIQLMLDGLKYISPVKASILTILEPVVTVILGVTLLAEQISTLQLIGIVIVLIGAIIIQLERAPRSDLVENYQNDA